MNTPAHVVLNALALGRGRGRERWLPITAGALLPDLPMVGFYLYQRLVLGSSEAWIWSQAYYAPAWQGFFDLFNSLPLIAVGALVAWRLRSGAVLALLASMALHALADLPLHHEDAHAHFFPLSSWRFRSPVSYWDPSHHGLAFAVAEGLLVAAGATILIGRRSSRGWRAVGALTLVSYVGLGGFAWLYWAG